MRIDEFIGKSAARLVKASNSNVLLITKRKESDVFDLTLFKENDKNIVRTTYSVSMPRLPPGSVPQIRAVILRAVEKGIIQKGEYIFCVADKSLGRQFEGLFLLFKIDESFLGYTKKRIEQDSKATVFETVLNIAREIGREGREGRKIGTAFIIGDAENVLRKSTQLILNPFEGHLKQNVMNFDLKETIKEFAQLDGVFVIGGDGTIYSVGRYLSVDTSGINLPGLGARHLSAAAITKQTKSTAIVVSESGGIIRVFKNGKLVLEEIP